MFLDKFLIIKLTQSAFISLLSYVTRHILSHFGTIDTLSTCPIPFLEIPTLDHKSWYNPVEYSPLVSEFQRQRGCIVWFQTCTESSKVRCGLDSVRSEWSMTRNEVNRLTFGAISSYSLNSTRPAGLSEYVRLYTHIDSP